jgi:3-dehydro-L-gulonate 2-dehydrogenase
LEILYYRLNLAKPAKSGSEIYYPGEQSLRSRHENLAQGIPVDENIWEAVQKLAM